MTEVNLTAPGHLTSAKTIAQTQSAPGANIAALTAP